MTATSEVFDTSQYKTSASKPEGNGFEMEKNHKMIHFESSQRANF
jgi:hypothetical protein